MNIFDKFFAPSKVLELEEKLNTLYDIVDDQMEIIASQEKQILAVISLLNEDRQLINELHEEIYQTKRKNIGDKIFNTKKIVKKQIN